MTILTEKKPRPWQIPEGAGKGRFASAGYYLGSGSTALEVAIATTSARPTEGDVRSLWKRRKANTPSPLLLMVVWTGADGERVWLCGPLGDSPPVYPDRDLGQVERIAASALAEPDHHAASRFLASYLPEEAGGLRNIALFSTHHLVERVPRRLDWSDLCRRGEKLIGLRRDQLVEALGFSVEPKGHAAVLRAAGNARALAVFLDDNENADATSSRFNSMTPVSWAIASAAADNIPYVIVTRGPQLRIYTTMAGAGAGGKGGTGTFLEINLALLTDVDSGYLPLLFSADSLLEGGDFETLLKESHDYAVDVGSRLRSRVYDYAVPAIADALVAHHETDRGKTDEATLEALYDQALLVLFRLLFVAYAEDRDLLPLRTNGLYRQRSLKQIARDLALEAERVGSLDDIEFDANSTDQWDNVRALWTAIDKGRKNWNVPIYNGGMFSSDPVTEPIGAGLAGLELTNAEFGPALAGLLVDEIDAGRFGPVDFASLDVREFGTIYEGLLESNLAVAPVDLTIGKDDTWVPAGLRDEIWVEAGGVYLHNKSGARKASGSYFTKPFAVNHLLDHALERALDDHVARLGRLLEGGDEVGAADAFFDLRCADLSMGSGHFLVAAVDRIERRLSEFLVDHHIPGVHNELARLRAAAEHNLAEAGIPSEGADTNALLRRQIARRCIYGTDLNPTAVELARLALWLHTFVRGLPLTSLNHGLVQGNSLTGIGTLDEVIEVLDPDRGAGAVSFVRLAILEALEGARTALKRFAATSEATAAEVKEARKAHLEAEKAVAPVALLFDLAVAVRAGATPLPTAAFDVAAFGEAANRSGATAVAQSLNPVHFPLAFPEVFLRERPGFDCILGNPPWEEVMVDEHSFWSTREPGIRSLPAAGLKSAIARLRRQRPDWVAEYETEVRRTDQIRHLLSRGQYPQMNEGNADLYKAFCWRFWDLAREDGVIGVVLPRTALSGKGTSMWRTTVLERGAFSDTTMLLNTGGWVFDDAEHRYTMALVAIRKGIENSGEVSLRGPYSSLARYREGVAGPPDRFKVEDFLSWSESASFPLLPSANAATVFKKLRAHPSLGQHREVWRARPIQGDFNATTDKSLFILKEEDAPGDAWPVYKGASFNLWQHDTGIYYAWADPDVVTTELQRRRVKGQGRTNSPFSEFSREWATDSNTLPCLSPRIAFRDIARATDTRTLIACLVPGGNVITNKAPYLLWSQGDERDEAFLLGVLCSIPLDWYARRVVEVSVNFHLFNNFPIPDPGRSHAIRRRVEEIAGRLAAADSSYAVWAKAVGVPIGGAVDQREKDDLIAELDAAVALLYGLEEEDIKEVFSTFHVGWRFEQRLASVLDHVQRLS